MSEWNVAGADSYVVDSMPLFVTVSKVKRVGDVCANDHR